MNYLYILCFVCLCCKISCAPLPTFYEAIVKKCPLIKSLSSFKDDPLFTNACKDWKTISTVTELNHNEREIRCLLFFDSFTQYCTKTKVINVTMTDSISIKYSKEDVCSYAKNLPHKTLSSIFSSQDNCKQVCTDDLLIVNSVCNSAYYFAHLNVGTSSVGDLPVNVHLPPSNEASRIQQVSNNNLGTPKTSVPIDEQKSDRLPENGAPGSKVKVPAQSYLQPPTYPGGDVVAIDSSKVQSLSNSLPKQENHNGVVDADLKSHGDNNQPPPIPPISAKAAPAISDVAQQENAQTTDGAKQRQDQEVNGNGNQNTKLDGSDKPVDENDAHVPDTSDKQTNNNNEDTKSNEAVSQKNHDNEKSKLTNKQETEDKNTDFQDTDVGKGNTQLEQDLENEQDLDGENDEIPPPLDSMQSDKVAKPLQTDDSLEPVNYNTEMEGDSYFFTYFMALCIVFIVGYVCYHNKQKILALILEGRRGKRQYRGGRRPNSANYHKLDSNLEEAITSSCKKNTNNVIY